jgi:PAS domain S-box-containing protein
MASSDYSFIDIAVLDEVRSRFARGDGLAILSADLEEVIWANGPGASLFGYPDIEAIMGASAGLAMAQRRQIAATPGFPDIGRDRPLLIRLSSGVTSRATQFLATSLVMPDGEPAILLASPASSANRDPEETARRAISGFTEAGYYAALVGPGGNVLSASPGFEALAIAPDTVALLVMDVADEGDRLVKRLIDAARGRIPAGIARLTDEPATHLLVVVDDDSYDWDENETAVGEAVTDSSIHDPAPDAPAVDEPGAPEIDPESRAEPAQSPREASPSPTAEEPPAETEVAPASPPNAADADGEAAPPPLAVSDQDNAPVHIDRWYFEDETDDRGDLSADDPARDDAVAEDTTAPSAIEEPSANEEVQPIGSDQPDAPGEAGVPPIEPRQHDDETSTDPVTSADPVAGEAADTTSEISTETPSAPVLPTRMTTTPVRFVWRTDADGRFSIVSPEFTEVLGEPAGGIVGRTFAELSAVLGIDPEGDIAGLLARRDTWSGRCVQWPIAGQGLRVPVDLAALPVYARDRSFEGFRGFGIARMADAVIDDTPRAAPLAPASPESPKRNEDTSVMPPPVTDEAPEATTPPHDVEPEDARTEVPVIPIESAMPRRRRSDKVIRLAEHRSPNPERALSPGESIAFREIGDRLKKIAEPAAESTPPPEDTGASADVPVTPDALDSRADDGQEPRAESDPSEDAQTVLPDTAQHPEATAPAPEGEPAHGDGPEHEEATAPIALTEDGYPAAGEPVAEPDEAGDESTASEGAPALDDDAETPLAQKEAPHDEAEAPTFPAPDGAVDETPSTTAGGITEVEADSPIARDEALDSEADAPEPAAAEAEVTAETLSATVSDAETGPEPSVADAPAEPPPPSGENGAAANENAPPATERATGPKPVDADIPAQARFVPSAFATSGHGHGAEDVGAGIFAALPVPILVHSGDILHFANEAFWEMSGYGSLDELYDEGGLGGLFVEAYDEDDEAPRRGSAVIRTRDGRELSVRAHLQRIPWQGGKALLLAFGPLGSIRGPETEAPALPDAVQAAALAEYEARVEEMRTILDTATDGVILIAPDGSIRSINRPAEALFGYESVDVMGKAFASLFAVESQRAARDYLNGLSDNGVASVLNDGREVIGRESQGRFIPLFMTIGRLPGGNGYCAVMRDITSWKRAEEELTQARVIAERASRQKTDFLARVSHEIRTPLNAIIGFSELMVDEKFGPIGNDRYRDYLRDINRSGNHVLDLVNDLLDISKIEAGEQEMSYEAVSLNDTLSETVALMQPQANRERVIIRSSFASRLPDVVADQRSIRQIGLNLLSNAIRFTQPGGQVIVSTSYESTGDVVLRVRDTGVGMSSAEIEQALKPFKQINSLKRSRVDGTGLGLPLTKAMVEANRARFTINSTPGEGTMVEIVFPSTRVLAE